MSLFAEAPGGGAPPSNSYLCSFNAGKCIIDSQNVVTAQKEKGVVCVYMAEGMPNFQWKSRETPSQEDSPMFLFPGDGNFRKCKSAKDARVYYLHIQASNVRKFFWMQDKDDTKDTENCKRMDDVINGITTTTTDSSLAMDTSSDIVDASDVIGESEMEALQSLAPEEREQVIRMLGMQPGQFMNTPAPAPNPNMTDVETPAPPPDLVEPPVLERRSELTNTAQPPPTTTDPSPAVTTSTQPMQFSSETLRNVMAGVGAVLQAQKEENSVNISDVLSSEKLFPLLNEEAFVSALVPLLPEGQQTIDALKDNVASPQYSQALASFGHALSSEDAVAMMSQFGVDPAVVAEGGGGAVGLLHAIQKQVDAEEKKESKA
eukprot:m.95929 g.95929  ORF g.95929 m.95929 type:complete len:375 (+) comp26855_c4_seq1:137-1261(+)